MKSVSILVTIFCAATLAAATVKTNAVDVPISAASQLLIPVAGSTPGANGTFFRSDITIINFANHDQDIQLQWLPDGMTGTGSTTIHLVAGGALRSPDFVSEILAKSGLGSIIVTGVTSAGALDTSAAIYASSRIWTPQPGTNGTTSQSLPAVPLAAVGGTQLQGLFALGVPNQPDNFRSNVGIVNLDPTNEQTFAITMPGSSNANATIVVVPPMSMAQVSVGVGLLANQEVLIQNVTPTATRSNSWISYGSTVDNTTGDAWSELALPGTAP